MPIRLGVCSWSLQPEGADQLGALVREAGVGAVQLALDPLRTRAMAPVAVATALTGVGARILSGMVTMTGEDYTSLESIRATGGLVGDEYWLTNLRAAEANARLAADLGLPLVTFHAGFIPADRGDPSRALLLDRMRRIVAPFLGRKVRVGLETGQEDADTIIGFLMDLDRDGVGVNYDPANMLLYGNGDPVEALDLLADFVVQIHIRDALPSATPGVWGQEVAVGAGAVDWGALFDVVRTRALEVDLLIEREAGATRMADIKAAAALVRAYGMEAFSPAVSADRAGHVVPAAHR